ncbi:MAG: DUF6265 family protein [Bacteroidota bacterium]|nr:DUF6265 family protein [Bacteroidota bacterium]
MYREIKSLIILCLIISFSFCSEIKNEKNVIKELKTYSKIGKATWLIGSWQNSSSNGIGTEIWKKENDSVFSGTSFLLFKKDTAFLETFSLIQKGNEVSFVPIVKNQNNGKPVQFILSESKKNKLIFENPKHDFPQKITYSLITNDSMLAEISGLQDGKEKTIQFPFKRVN